MALMLNLHPRLIERLDSTYSFATLQIGLEWSTVSQLSVLQEAREALQGQYRYPSIGCVDNQMSSPLLRLATVVVQQLVVPLRVGLRGSCL